MRVEERSGEGSFYNTKYVSDKPGLHMPYEPDHGEQLRKAFAVILIIIMIIAVLSFFVSAFIKEENSWLKAEESKFIGTWELSGYYSSSSKTFWTFYENETLKMVAYYDYYDLEYYAPAITFTADISNSTLTVTNIEESTYMSQYVTFGSYKLENGKLYVKEDFYYSSYQRYNYRFSENNSKLYLLYPSSSSNVKTLTRAYAGISYSNISWEDINITISSSGTFRYDWINLTRSPVSYYGSHAPVEWGDMHIGDIIQFGEYSFDTYAKFECISYNEIIGAWYFPGDNKTVSTDIVAYWDFNESTGDVILDKSGNDRYGIINGAIWVPGVEGSALQFNGSNIVSDISSSWDDDIENVFTVACWVKWDGHNGAYDIIFDGRDDLWDMAGFCLYINNSKLTMHLNQNLSQTGSIVTSNSNIPIGNWTHLAIVFDGNMDYFKLYINSNLDKTASTNSTFRNSTHFAAIGNNHWAPGDGNWRSFNGVIDQLLIYNRALSADEIQNLYNHMYL